VEMRLHSTAWTFVHMLNPDLTSRAMNSSGVAHRRKDPILSWSPQAWSLCSHHQQLAPLACHESYGSQRSAIRGNSLRYLESSPLFSHKHGQHSLVQTQAGWLRRFETQFSRRSAMRIMYGTPPLLIEFTTPIFDPIHHCNVISLPMEVVTSAC